MVSATAALLLTVIATTVVQGQNEQTVCPSCIDAYDHTSCTQSLTCAVGDVCVLQVETRDNNRLQYVCQSALECPVNGSLGCETNIESYLCSYCCLGVVSCEKQRTELFVPVVPVNETVPANSTLP